jgi:hypothetical protein
MPKISYRGGLYEGTLKDGVPHGKGILKWESGDEYRGQWQDGKMTGFGIRFVGNGRGGYFSRTQGYFVDGQLQYPSFVDYNEL